MYVWECVRMYPVCTYGCVFVCKRNVSMCVYVYVCLSVCVREKIDRSVQVKVLWTKLLVPTKLCILSETPQ